MAGRPAAVPGNGVRPALPDEAGYDLALMFVAPEAMGRGIGRRLFDGVVGWLRTRGARRLEILADPNAAPFYERMGAVRIGDAPSDAIPGRRLPLYEYRLPPEGD